MLSMYIDFEVDDHTGRSLTIEERVARHNDRLLAFQVSKLTIVYVYSG
jgi:hypothetical protein